MDLLLPRVSYVSRSRPDENAHSQCLKRRCRLSKKGTLRVIASISDLQMPLPRYCGKTASHSSFHASLRADVLSVPDDRYKASCLGVNYSTRTESAESVTVATAEYSRVAKSHYVRDGCTSFACPRTAVQESLGLCLISTDGGAWVRILKKKKSHPTTTYWNCQSEPGASHNATPHGSFPS